MEYLAADDSLEGLPLILAGPILRRTEADAVTVWVALKEPAQVGLQVLTTLNSGAQLDQCIFQGQRETIAIGQHLHIVAVTAHSLTDELLHSDRLYAYDLQFNVHLGASSQKTSSQKSASQTISLAAALTPPHQTGEPTDSISYFDHQKPTFTLPPSNLKHLKIVHGSCRKPHGEGFDALPILDCLIAAEAHNPQLRPHQLLMTGDQIYGDDVADPLLWLATQLGEKLLGWTEKLPFTPEAEAPEAEAPEAEDTPQTGHLQNTLQAHPQQLPAGQRTHFATRQAGLTAGLKGKEKRVTSHLFSFGEYCAVYLLAHSPACWRARGRSPLPDGKQVTQGRKTIRRWNNDKHNMEQFLYSLWKVRRLLANIATYSIFDDHDVSDDWNLNQSWCLRTLGKPLGYRTVQNALLANAIFQAWGNTPQQFEADDSADRPGLALLAAAQKWSRAGGEDPATEKEIAAYLGLPPIDSHTGLPQFTVDKDVWILRRSASSLTWHYTIRSACHEVVVLDTRTWRGYPMVDDPLAPPMLLSPTAFQQQLQTPLSQPPPETAYATFVVAPTNVFGMRALDWIQQWHLDRRKVFSADVGDSWNFHSPALATLLTTLVKHRQNVVVLSGDIHYSSAIRANYQNLQTGDRSTLMQLTSSAIKNEESLTRVLHTRLKEWLLPERSRHWLGWVTPPDLKELPVTWLSARRLSSKQPAEKRLAEKRLAEKYAAAPPDWRCQMHWLRRQKSQPVGTEADVRSLIPPRARSRASIFTKLKFWQARWFQEGNEVVGVNNIALVRFCDNFRAERSDRTYRAHGLHISDPAPSGPNKTLRVQQDHYWFSVWLPIQLVRSRFE
ncbi:MAG: PhoD-like phosphatase [Phormidesmis sp.]